MSFKENLRQKIWIDQLARRVEQTLGSAAGGKKIDKTAMRSLLDTAGYQATSERGMDLYRQHPETEQDHILVLDNELAIYHTSLNDVLLRKNPNLKEMVNIFNMVKILNDKDVVVSKGSDSLSTIRAQCLADLDLSYTESDIREIADEGRKALLNENDGQVKEIMALFAEILSLTAPPIPVALPDLLILGRLQGDASDEFTYGPLILYDHGRHRLQYFDCRLDAREMKKPEAYLDMAGGKKRAMLEGGKVFDALAEQVLAEAPELTT